VTLISTLTTTSLIVPGRATAAGRRWSGAVAAAAAAVLLFTPRFAGSTDTGPRRELVLTPTADSTKLPLLAGGGSSTMLVAGTTMTPREERFQRPVGNALLVVTEADVADEDDPLEIFAAEQWYRAANAKEQVFEGVLGKKASPGATAGRWNPVRLEIDEKTTREVYLGGTTDLLDDWIGRRVRIVGKPMDVLGHAEIWPARLEPLPQPAGDR